MKASNMMQTAGLILVIGGFLALLAPFAVSIAITVIVGFSFLVAGMFNAWAAFQDSFDRLPHAIFAAFGIFLGISFLAHPLGGLISLTVLVGLGFLLSGVFRLLLAWQRRDHPAYWMLLLSGALSVLLGGMIFADILGATSILGILLGIELLFAGFGLITLSRMGR